MTLSRRLFGNRVARQLFTSFALATLVPISTSAVLTVVEAYRTLHERAAIELQQASRDFGGQLVERLNVAERQRKSGRKKGITYCFSGRKRDKFKFECS